MIPAVDKRYPAKRKKLMVFEAFPYILLAVLAKFTKGMFLWFFNATVLRNNLIRLAFGRFLISMPPNFVIMSFFCSFLCVTLSQFCHIFIIGKTDEFFLKCRIF